MKRFLALMLSLFLITALVACNQNEWYDEIMVTPAIDFTEFLTLEDFLNAYIAVGTENTIFASLEILYLPAGIPEEFEIGLITVTEYYVAFRFLPKEVSPQNRNEFWDAMSQYPSFEFSIFWVEDAEYEMGRILQDRNVSRAELIDEKYLFDYPNLFVWEGDGALLSLYTPRREHNERGESIVATEIGGVPLDNPYEMIQFTETVTIDLRDTNAVRAMITELAER